MATRKRKPRKKITKPRQDPEVSSAAENEIIYVPVADTADIPGWFTFPDVYFDDKKGTRLFKLPSIWRIKNPVTTYAFKIPENLTRVGENAEFTFYLKHILVTDSCIENREDFLLMLDLHLELQPAVKELVEEAAAKGECIKYLKSIQPSYNVLSPTSFWD